MAKSTSITKSEAIKRAIEAGATLPTEGVAYITDTALSDASRPGLLRRARGALAGLALHRDARQRLRHVR